MPVTIRCCTPSVRCQEKTWAHTRQKERSGTAVFTISVVNPTLQSPHRLCGTAPGRCRARSPPPAQRSRTGAGPLTQTASCAQLPFVGSRSLLGPGVGELGRSTAWVVLGSSAVSLGGGDGLSHREAASTGWERKVSHLRGSVRVDVQPPR